MVDVRGYLLPAGDAYTDEMRCALVFYPAKDEYLYALGGALDYLGTWRAWDRDVLKRGKDAARAWKNATEVTRECWSMGICDDILDTLQNIEKLLGERVCCDGSTTIGPVITVTTTIEPGQGDAPTHWGETAVADWDEWLEYVCYHAHAFVGQLVQSAQTLDTIAEFGSWTVEIFANVLRVLRFLTLVYPVSYAAALEIYESFKSAGDTSETFDGVATKFESARSDIVCAFIQGTSVSDAVETALDDATLWGWLYQFNDYDATQALVYEGTADRSVYLAPVKRDDCSCDDVGPCGFYPNPYFTLTSDPHILNPAYWSWTASGHLGEPGVIESVLASVLPTGEWRTNAVDFPLGYTGFRVLYRLWESPGQNFRLRIQFYETVGDVWVGTVDEYSGFGAGWADNASGTYNFLTGGVSYYCLVRVDISGGPSYAWYSTLALQALPCSE